MKNIRQLALILIIFTFIFAPLYGAKGQEPTENMQTFFNHEIPGMIITANATAETQPNENITVKITINPLEEVSINYFNLSVFGFINGTYKTMICNITVNNFPFNDTFPVPGEVWGVTYGEITLTYDVTYVIQQGNIQSKTTITYEDLKVGFAMTSVENVYLGTVEEQLENLNSVFEQLNQTFWQIFHMNLTEESLASLNETYHGLQGTSNDLSNTRMAVGILAVTTVFFVATTLYLVMRKPKESW